MGEAGAVALAGALQVRPGVLFSLLAPAITSTSTNDSTASTSTSLRTRKRAHVEL